ncbi:probable E3 ubiquitin ligase complex SCF subunit sconB [Trichoplusia ni]|uniref:Probable E3 ubiquitin ligase complex SCF subunit sconB n=1 Tax=Trichoplusia ni TaxID=7111 RepID=A0A7E5VHE2_TRINI|nr:probable E3 ubiquitin ligase complex SCF subunit sconB [Trichoplusia ni]
MYHSGIFVFGAKTFDKETKRDAISALPLEISWKIFSYLDATSLQIATRTHKTWKHIILSHRKLRNRLNKFELAIKLGSESLAKFYRKNIRKLKKEKGKNYLPVSKTTIVSSERVTIKNKRECEGIVVYTKRFRLY